MQNRENPPTERKDASEGKYKPAREGNERTPGRPVRDLSSDTGILCLTLEHGHSVMLGDEIEVFAYRHQGSTRVVFYAPKSVRIMRRPVWEREQAKRGMGNA